MLSFLVNTKDLHTHENEHVLLQSSIDQIIDQEGDFPDKSKNIQINNDYDYNIRIPGITDPMYTYIIMCCKKSN